MAAPEAGEFPAVHVGGFGRWCRVRTGVRSLPWERARMARPPEMSHTVRDLSRGVQEMSHEDADQVAGPAWRLFEELLMTGHTIDPADMPQIVNRYADAMGLHRITIYLADVQQKMLFPLTEELPPLQVDDSESAGWAYRTSSLRVAEDANGMLTAWFPLLEGAERLGVLGVQTQSLQAQTLRRCRRLAALIATVITAKLIHSDSVAHSTRSRSMQLPAEMLRAFLPPRTLGTEDVVSTALLEPAYEVGGDAFDHAFGNGVLHATILDAMGHDLASGLVTSVAMACGRNARRSGADLHHLVANVDDALYEWLPDRHCTGVFIHLHVATGVMRWVNCGHPPPMLIRNRRVIEDAFERVAEPPLGLPGRMSDAERTIHETTLEPGDRVLLYTDGVTEARADDGRMFGLERFTDFIIRASMADEPAPETLRRIMNALLDHQNYRLTDDASILVLEWRPPAR